MYLKKILFILLILILTFENLNSQSSKRESRQTKVPEQNEIREKMKVSANQKELDLTIRNVDISKYPEVTLILEAYNILGEPVDTLLPSQLHVLEGGVEKKIISVEKISVKERVAVDFVFVLDKTGTMQKYMDAVRDNIIKFTNTLMSRGIDFRIGLVLFSDIVEQIFQPSDNVYSFINWINSVRAEGGNDEKENALEALKFSTKMNFRPAANRVAVLITDAQFHQKGENGDGVTDQTPKSVIKLLNDKDVRLFAIAPPKLMEYTYMTDKTSGKVFDIDYPFSTILNNFSTQLTNLYALRYKTAEPAIPDSLDISLLNEKREELVKKTISVLDVGRKMIIENLLYKTGNSELADSVPELEIVYEYMNNKPAVAILVEGHTDAVGSNQVNDRLSLLRAESVKRYLLRKGINENRIKTQGYGKRKPIASNDTDFGRRLNRRTEIVIIAK
jgi:outer membrane protein OmpA-like peptidoglycan-associated protein